MKQRFLLLPLGIIYLFLFADNISANPVSRQQVQKYVQSFLKEKGKNLSIDVPKTRSFIDDNDEYGEKLLFFNIENNGGFVVASGDDSTPVILGYTDSGSYNENSLPDNMKSWLKEYERQIEYNNKSKAASIERVISNHSAISPLLTTTWDQGNPYNQKCPIQPIRNKRCVTGCVATAMAQVMYYHRDKSVNRTTNEIPGYICKEDGKVEITVETIPEGSFIDWDNMLDSYNGTESQTQIDAVASLMAYCGAAVRMGYGTGTSVANYYNVFMALQKYFNYKETLYFESRNNYTDKDWDDLIYSELANGNPIFYSGQAEDGSIGHAFVCDGYDGNGFFHINWGWGGQSDGHFLLSALNPYNQGIGGGRSGYNKDQLALIDAVPKEQNYSDEEPYAVFNDGVLTFYYDKYRSSRNGETYSLNSGYEYPGWTWEKYGSRDYRRKNTDNIKKVVFDNSFANATPTSAFCWFDHCTNLKEIDGISNLNTASITNMFCMFSSCRNLERIDVSNFSTSNVSDYYEMFSFCTSLNKIDISNFDFKKDASIGSMFSSCSNLTEVIVDLPEHIEELNSIYYRCSSLTSVTIPRGIKQLTAGDFQKCDNLITVISEIKEPYDISDNIFPSGVYSNATLKVPFGKKSAYASKQGWSKFKTIEEMPKTTFTLKYVVDGVDYKSFEYEKGESITSEPEPTKEGYSFSGWSYIPSTMPADDVTVTGSFTINKYKLTYMIDGEVYKSYDVEYGSKITAEAAPAKEGYTFNGWSGIPSTMPAKDVTVSGLFSKNDTGKNIVYKIVDGEAVVDINESATGDVEIDSSVTIDGKTYRVTAIGDDAFKGCYGVRSITIPNSVTTIGKYAFDGCSGLTSIAIPSSVTKIGYWAFSNCTRLKKVIVMDMSSWCKIDFEDLVSNPLYHAKHLYSDENTEITDLNIPEGVKFITEKAFVFCSSLKSVVISSSVTSIEKAAFYECSELTSITISNSVNTIGGGAFYGCSGLKKVIVKDIAAWCSIKFGNFYSNPLYYANHMYSDENTEITDLIIPNGVKNIEYLAFENCVGLKSVTIPNSVTSLGSKPFSGCSGLSFVSIPNSVTSIGANSFENCSSLTTIEIGKGIRTIYSNAFAKCSKLTDVYCYAEKVSSTSNETFYGTSIEAATLHVPKNSLSYYRSTAPWKDFKSIVKLYMPEHTLTYIVDGEVYKMYQVEEGDAIIAETAPIKQGYKFSGWSEIPSTMPDHDVTVTGTFERVYDVGDVAKVVSLSMNDNTDAVNLALYDMNNDGEINIGDIILMVKAILNNAGNKGSATRTRADEAIDLTKYTAAQFEIKLPTNVDMRKIRLVRPMMWTHEIMYQQTDEQTYAVVVYSLTNQLMKPENGNIIDIDVEGTRMEGMSIRNAILATPQGETTNYGGNFVTTGVEAVDCGNGPAVIYDLKGNRLDNGNSRKKGVYIINGKKVAVK